MAASCAGGTIHVAKASAPGNPSSATASSVPHTVHRRFRATLHPTASRPTDRRV